jgi:hypothetical protein
MYERVIIVLLKPSGSTQPAVPCDRRRKCQRQRRREVGGATGLTGHAEAQGVANGNVTLW